MEKHPNRTLWSTMAMAKTILSEADEVEVSAANRSDLMKTRSIDADDRDSATTKRKTSAGPSGSSDGKSSTRGGSKGGLRHGGKHSPTAHSNDGASDLMEKILPRFESFGTDTAASERWALLRIIRFRWIVPANGEIHVRLRFVSNEVGQFDQTISFELMGTKRNYKIFCRGICTFPTISREPRSVHFSRLLL